MTLTEMKNRLDYYDSHFMICDDDAILYYLNENVNIKGINIYVYTDKEKQILKRIVNL